MRVPTCHRVNNSSNEVSRFDIEDRKGLEIVILTALLTFQEPNEGFQADGASVPSSPTIGGRAKSLSARTKPQSGAADHPPPPPPKPVKTGLEQIAEMQAIRSEINEVIVGDEGSAEDYAQYCWNLLQV